MIYGADCLDLFIDGDQLSLTIIDPLAASAHAQESEHHLRAPMPGRVIAVPVQDGAVVERGTPLIVLEAMKMEHTLRAPGKGRVVRVRFAVGDQVSDGAELVEWEPQES